MPQFMYFLPRDTQAECRNLQELIAAGATHIDASLPFTSNFTNRCPGDVAGSLVTLADRFGETPPSPNYDPAKQVWRKATGAKYWVGMDKTSRPTPESLARKKMLQGCPARLQDGNDWIVPVCVPAIFQDQMKEAGLPPLIGRQLPVQMDLSDNDEIVTRLVEAYEGIAERCHAFFSEYVGFNKPPENVSPVDRFNQKVSLAVELLTLNYHVSRVEVIGLLGCFTSDTWMNVLRAAIEADALDAMFDELEKKESASAASATEPGTSVGVPNSSAATSS